MKIPSNLPQNLTNRNVELLSAANTTILVVDVQNYCSVPDRGYNTGKSKEDCPYFFQRCEESISVISKVLDECRESKVQVIYTVVSNSGDYI